MCWCVRCDLCVCVRMRITLDTAEWQLKLMLSFFFDGSADFDAGRLERGAVQWHGKDEPLGSLVLCRSDDIWKLRAVQSAGCDFGRRI